MLSLRMTARAGRWLAAVLSLAPMLAFGADDPVSTDRLLPPTTFVYVTCPSVDTLKARFAESSFGKLWNDSSMAAFREEVDTNLEKAAEQFQSKVGVPLFDVLGLPKGQATFAVSTAGTNELGIVLLADVGEDSDTLEAVLDKIDAQFEEHEAEKSSETVEGVEITLFKPKASEDGGARGPRQVGYFVKDTFVVFSSSKGLLTAILERWDGEHSETFAENSVYQDTISACRDSADVESDLYYFIDPVALISAGLSADPGQAMASALFNANLSKLGLDKLKAIGGASNLESEDFDSVGRTLITIEQPITGIPKIFRMPARQQSPPAWVDAATEQYSSISWDPPGAYKAIGEIYEAMTGQVGGFDAAVDQIASHPANPGIHPKKDIFDQMTGLVHMVGSHPARSESISQQLLVAIGIKDDVQMQSLLEKLSAKAGGAMERRDFEGTTVYDFKTTESGDEDAPSPALAVSRNYLFISTHAPALEEALRGGTSSSNPLADSEEYQAVAKHFPSQVSTLSFAKSGAGIEALWNQARSGAFEEQIEGFDFKTLPEFETVKKFFAPSGSYIVPHEKGSIFVQFALPVE